MLLHVDDIGRQIGGRTLYQGVQFQVRARDRVGLVGPNGAGKSTLLRGLAELEPQDNGHVSKPRGVRVALLRQEMDPGVELAVHAEVASALREIAEAETEVQEVESEIARRGTVSAELADRYDQAQAHFRTLGGFERDARVAEVLAGLGFDDEARKQPVRSFSGGWLMRIELAKLLLSGPDVLLLDEPTNHLDLPAIEWFEETLAEFRGGIIIVSHDRSFLRRHVNRVAELDGHGRFTFYDVDYDRYLESREQRRTLQQAEQQRQDRKIAHMEKFVERFGAKATKARQAQSRKKALERMKPIAVEPEKKRRMKIRIPEPVRSGDRVLTLEEIHKSYDEQKVYCGASLSLKRGDRVALAGPNGAGKSTLLRVAAGLLDIDSGNRELGHNVEVAFFGQHQWQELAPRRTVLEELEAGAQLDDGSRLRSHLGAFLFSGDDIKKRVSVLSGGEKARLALAKMLLRPRNFLILDEPTNHLDIESREVLEEALAGFAGTLLFVSHDRTFINSLATRVIDVNEGILEAFTGNYDDFVRQKSNRNPAATPDAPTEDRSGAPRKQVRRHEDRLRRKSRERTLRRIERLEATILEHEELRESLTWKVGAPDAYRDPERLRSLEQERTTTEEKIASLYADWEQLADELEQLSEEEDAEA